MTSLQMTQQDKSVLRWGGVAGLLGGLFFLLAIVQVAVFVPPDPTELVGWVTRFPDVQALRVVENVLYLSGLVLSVPLFLALFWALRKRSLAAGLFGSVLATIGLSAMITSASPHVAHATLSELYLRPEATAADQASLVLMWQAVWGVADAMLYVGFFVVPLGLILLGIGMWNEPAFGKGFGGVSLLLGAIGLAAAVLQMIDPAAVIGAITYFALIIFCLVLGWKVYRVSKHVE